MRIYERIFLLSCANHSRQNGLLLSTGLHLCYRISLDFQRDCLDNKAAQGAKDNLFLQSQSSKASTEGLWDEFFFSSVCLSELCIFPQSGVRDSTLSRQGVMVPRPCYSCTVWEEPTLKFYNCAMTSTEFFKMTSLHTCFIKIPTGLPNYFLSLAEEQGFALKCCAEKFCRKAAEGCTFLFLLPVRNGTGFISED